MMWDWDGWWPWMTLMMVVFWGGIIALVVWIIVKLTKRSGIDAEKRNPLDIAKERYAKGEITKEEFDRIKKDLS